MENNEKRTVLSLSAPTDNEQPLVKNTIYSINEKDEDDKIAESLSPDYLYTVSLTELYDTIYTPRTQVIDDLLCAGTYLFAGAPKVGKSFFMAQLAYHVSNGMDLWEYRVHEGTVLYLALEDDYSRLQKRLSKMFGMEEGTDKLRFATDAKHLGEGLDAQLEVFLKKHSDTKLIIIDTLQKIREMGGEQYSYASDYEIVTRLKTFSDKHNICVLLVHHTRKQSAEDCFETISGTNGLLGAADGAFIMQKEKRTDVQATLDIVGRDQQDQRLHLFFERECCIWRLTKAETELWKEAADPVLEAVANLLSEDVPQWTGSASELSETLELTLQPNVLTRKLNVSVERLRNEHGIHYGSTRTHEGRKIELNRIEE